MRGLSARRIAASLVCVAMLHGCATTPSPSVHGTPSLRLAPAELGRPLSLQQHIVARYPTADGGQETREAIAMLEADDRQVRVAALAGGQVMARLAWDGRLLDTWRAPWAPAQLAPERVLDDLQLALWPVRAISHVLPADWTLADVDGKRVLRQGNAVVTEVSYPAPDVIVIRQLRSGYALTITTLRTEAAR